MSADVVLQMMQASQQVVTLTNLILSALNALWTLICIYVHAQIDISHGWSGAKKTARRCKEPSGREETTDGG